MFKTPFDAKASIKSKCYKIMFNDFYLLPVNQLMAVLEIDAGISCSPLNSW